MTGAGDNHLLEERGLVEPEGLVTYGEEAAALDGGILDPPVEEAPGEVLAEKVKAPPATQPTDHCETPGVTLQPGYHGEQVCLLSFKTKAMEGHLVEGTRERIPVPITHFRVQTRIKVGDSYKAVPKTYRFKDTKTFAPYINNDPGGVKDKVKATEKYQKMARDNLLKVFVIVPRNVKTYRIDVLVLHHGIGLGFAEVPSKRYPSKMVGASKIWFGSQFPQQLEAHLKKRGTGSDGLLFIMPQMTTGYLQGEFAYDHDAGSGGAPDGVITSSLRNRSATNLKFKSTVLGKEVAFRRPHTLFDRQELIEEVFTELKLKGHLPAETTPGRIMYQGHSAGGRAAVGAMFDAYYQKDTLRPGPRPQGLILMDGIHRSEIDSVQYLLQRQLQLDANFFRLVNLLSPHHPDTGPVFPRDFVEDMQEPAPGTLQPLTQAELLLRFNAYNRAGVVSMDVGELTSGVVEPEMVYRDYLKNSFFYRAYGGAQAQYHESVNAVEDYINDLLGKFAALVDPETRGIWESCYRGLTHRELKTGNQHGAMEIDGVQNAYNNRLMNHTRGSALDYNGKGYLEESLNKEWARR